MANRDSNREHRRRGRGREDASTSQPSPDADADNAFATPDRIPSQVLHPPSAMPTPNYDPWFNFPYFNSTQVPPQMSDANLPPTNVGDLPRMSMINPAFWQTYGPYMPYNHNLVLSLFGNMQQGTPQRPPWYPTQNFKWPLPSQPIPQASQPLPQTVQPLASEPVQMPNTTKVLIEPEGDT